MNEEKKIFAKDSLRIFVFYPDVWLHKDTSEKEINYLVINDVFSQLPFKSL